MVETEEIVTITNTDQVLGDVASLYLNQKFSDITLLVDDQKIYAHKVILAIRSEYFEALLYPDLQDSKQDEIAITDVSLEAVRSLLKYIYTGTITISSDVALTLQVLGLAHQYSFKDLHAAITKKIKPLLNMKNVCAVLNTANLYDLEELRNACHSFMDLNASEAVSSDCFNDLSQKSMIKLLERSTFFAPEIEIFKSVAKWCKINNNVDDLVIQCVRLSWLSVVDIVSTVWPSKFYDCEKLLQAIAEIVGVKVRSSIPRTISLIDENIATPQRKAEVISGRNTSFLLAGTGNIDNFAYHAIDGKKNIVVKFNAPCYVNHFKIRLWDGDSRCYSYYIEVSLDQKNWLNVIDHRSIRCRSYQTLFFDQRVVQYVRIVGTNNTFNQWFHIISFEAYFKQEIPKILNGFICPKDNVATLDKNASVIEGSNPDAMLNGDINLYDESNGYTYSPLGNSVLVHLAQPYIISTINFLLWDKDNRRYRYYIETSLNISDWEMTVDRRNEDCQSWQNLRFKERAVSFIRIIGTVNTAVDNNDLQIVHFECPSQE